MAEDEALQTRGGLADQLMQADITRGLLGPIHGALEVGRYRVLESIGRGAMGTVYRAHDGKLGRDVALKVLRADGRANEQSSLHLVREAVTLARLRHPNVVTVHEVDRHGDDLYLVMELVDGVDLATWVRARKRRDRRLDPEGLRAAAQFLRQAAEGLDAAHRSGIVHRDVKPSNILVGEEGWVRVVDFGLAWSAGGQHGFATHPSLEDALAGAELEETQEDAVVGTLRYMAPEQRAGRGATALSDQFSFCVAAWEVLFADHPWRGEEPNATVPAVVGRGLWRSLGYSLQRGLALDPRHRHPTMRHLITDLERALLPRRGGVRMAMAGLGLAIAGGLGTQLLLRPSATAALPGTGDPISEPRAPVEAGASCRCEDEDEKGITRAVEPQLSPARPASARSAGRW